MPVSEDLYLTHFAILRGQNGLPMEQTVHSVFTGSESKKYFPKKIADNLHRYKIIAADDYDSKTHLSNSVIKSLTNAASD